ncbi:MAG: hypothetical protein M5U26_11650 [Planctomycetota bacterium]|nr:hypothetical protein [Planctomycetota bacterium]
MTEIEVKVAEVRRIIARSRDREKANRKDHILAANGMRSLEESGMPRARIYKEVGLDDKWGPMYFRLLEFYELLQPAELERLHAEDAPAEETRLLSLTQVQCMNRVFNLVQVEQRGEFVRKVMTERLTGRDIENLAGGRRDLAFKRLGLTEADLEAAKAALPRSPEPAYEATMERVVISPSARSLASLFAALSTADGIKAVTRAAKSKRPVEVRWRD